ncbi:MAG: hypothetical protein IJU56_08640, partial [Clostridia bacterium]|nr:hypothetical protein [Clostridia bacterium]
IKYTQFMVYDKDAHTMEPMTEENCNTELWTADRTQDHPKTVLQKLRAFFRSLKNWLPLFFAFVKGKLTK